MARSRKQRIKGWEQKEDYEFDFDEEWNDLREEKWERLVRETLED